MSELESSRLVHVVKNSDSISNLGEALEKLIGVFEFHAP